MSLSAIVFLLLYAAVAIVGIVYHPIFGIIGYYTTYIIFPAGRWWGAAFAKEGFRLNFIIALVALVALGVYAAREKIHNKISKQEVFLWLFAGIVFLVGLFSPSVPGGEDMSVKIAKTALMLFVLKRSVTDLSKFRWLMWALMLASIYGAFDTRLLANRIGSRIQSGSIGSDFAEGNFLALHMAMTLPIIGMLFLRSKWALKIFLAASAALMIDVIIQCRSRGAFLAILCGGAVALIFSPKKTRKAIFALAIIGAAGALFLVDAAFWSRMSDINADLAVEEQDASSAGRILAWKAALSMASDHPLGVGYNNFKALVGSYNAAIPGKDTHNTYLRCLAELGVEGLLVLLLMIGTALAQIYRLHRRFKKEPADDEYVLWNYALGVALVVYLTGGLFISATYVEEFYLILFLPDVFLGIYRKKAEEVSEIGSPLPAAGISA